MAIDPQLGIGRVIQRRLYPLPIREVGLYHPLPDYPTGQLVMEPGRVPCALKCTLILTSDLVKGWYGHLKKVGHACQI